MATETQTTTSNRFNLAELAGASGDLGTLIPFVVAYISVLKMDAGAILLPFGVMLIVAGIVFKTPFPVQPMKLIGAAAVLHSAGVEALTPGIVVAAGLITGAIWLLLGLTGVAQRVARWIPAPALLGVVLGLGFSFMLEGVRMMSQAWLFSTVMFAATLFLMSRTRAAAMAALLLAGGAFAVIEQPTLLADLALAEPALHLPTFAWPSLGTRELWLGLVLLALPQLPLTFGNAFVAVTDEHNRLFPDRAVSEKRVAVSTGLMNLFSSAIGGIPMCHGAGGLAGHVKFGARTGGASIMLGVLLTVLALFFADSVATLFRLFPPSVLGVILFMAGLELALASREHGGEKLDRAVLLATAAIAMFNVGVAVVFGLIAHHAARRGWLRL